MGFVPSISVIQYHYDIDALENGTTCIIQGLIEFKNGYIDIDSFGFERANVHTLLKWNLK